MDTSVEENLDELSTPLAKLALGLTTISCGKAAIALCGRRPLATPRVGGSVAMRIVGVLDEFVSRLNDGCLQRAANEGQQIPQFRLLDVRQNGFEFIVVQWERAREPCPLG
jgi:hypothetical protein